jgi:hypothetical protein
MNLNRVYQVGFPDFRDTVIGKYPGAFATMPEIALFANEIFAIPISERVHEVCRMLSKNIFTSCNALHLLCINGFGLDAMKIARSMFEGAVTVAYLQKHPEEADDYLDFDWIKKKKLLDFLENHDSERAKRIPSEGKKQILAEYDRVLPRFKYKNGKPRGRWSKKRFYELVTEVGAEKLYATYHDSASSMLHMDVAGVTSQMEHAADTPVCDADAAPSLAWIRQALVAGHYAVVVSMANYIRLAGVDRPDVVKGLQNGFVETWRVETAAV